MSFGETRRYIASRLQRTKPFIRLGDLGGVDITCHDCGKEYHITVTLNELLAYANGELVQRAFPALSKAERELFISATCGECFDRMFGEDE